jgi:pimeloyl-ACP methyl ester carboxylesterase
MIIIVPGSGKTNIVAGNWFYDLRTRFVQQGIACCVWDKAGCGKSEGKFDANQPVQNSAQEVISVIKELQHRKIAGSGKIGLWGQSRAGWICPLVIAEVPSIAFWISVSGTDDKETFGYLLERNFVIEGRTETEAKKLFNEWKNGINIARHGGTFEENLKATENLRSDSFYVFISGNSKPTLEGYFNWQKKFQTGETIIDDESGLQVYIPGFEQILRKVNCPVLALFGEKDSQVDWRKTMQFYKRTIGKNPKAKLTIKTFPDGNHNIQQCTTGGLREKLQPRKYCEGYYETMLTWLSKKNFGKQ